MTHVEWAPNLGLYVGPDLHRYLEVTQSVLGSGGGGSKLSTCSQNLNRVQDAWLDSIRGAASVVLGSCLDPKPGPSYSVGLCTGLPGSRLSSGPPNWRPLGISIGEGATHGREQWAAVMAQCSDSRTPPQCKRWARPASRAACHGWECWMQG